MRKVLTVLIGAGMLLCFSGIAQAVVVPDFSFESGWGGWTSQGGGTYTDTNGYTATFPSENGIFSADTFFSDDSNPSLQQTVYAFGNAMARINSYRGGDEESDDFTPPNAPYYVYNNYITQTFDWDGQPLSFWYNFCTFDYVPFDNPGFLVLLNGNELLRESPEGSDEGYDLLETTGWQQFTYNPADHNYLVGSSMVLALYAGNTGDDSVPSWVYIDNEAGSVTNQVVPEPASMLLFGIGLVGMVGRKISRKRT